MKKLAIALVGFAFVSASPAHAFDWFGGRLSIGGGYGRAKPKLPYSYQDTYQDGAMWTAHMSYFINNDFSLLVSYADLEPYRRGDKLDSYRFRPIIGGLRYNLLHHSAFTPYLTAGAGYAINKHEIPNIATQKWEGFTWQSGLGLEFFITEGTSLGAEALYHHFSGTNVDVYAPHRLISAVGTVNFYFGAGPSKRRSEEALAQQKQQTATTQMQSDAVKSNAAAAAQTPNQTVAAAAGAVIGAGATTQVQQAQAEVDQLKQLIVNKKINPITFETGSAELTNSSNTTLDKVADIAQKYPSLKLRVEGHTDNTGEADFNQRLSQRRADAVRDYIVNGGVPSGSVSAVGFGQTRPIDSNATPEGRAQNRRVDFIFNHP